MKIGVVQLKSVLEPAQNLLTIRKFLVDAKSQNANAVFLPEVFYSVSDGNKPSPYLVEGKNEHYLAIQKLAKDSGLYILGGSAATLVDGKVMNRSYNFGPDGAELMLYDKMNLFAVDLSKHTSQTVIDEAKIYTAGSTPKILPIGDFKILLKH
jgi:deaminated glutathione amidase